jgi:hypothetical protein
VRQKSVIGELCETEDGEKALLVLSATSKSDVEEYLP